MEDSSSGTSFAARPVPFFARGEDNPDAVRVCKEASGNQTLRWWLTIRHSSCGRRLAPRKMWPVKIGSLMEKRGDYDKALELYTRSSC